MPKEQDKRRLMLAGVLLAAALCCERDATAKEITFHHALDNSLLDVTPKPGEELSKVVLQFRQTGRNPYDGDAAAIAEGKKIYTTWCESCHMPDGTGGRGADLTAETHINPRIVNDVGLFEVVFGGAAGAMQPFSMRLSQDEILHVMAYVRTLMKH